MDSDSLRDVCSALSSSGDEMLFFFSLHAGNRPLAPFPLTKPSRVSAPCWEAFVAPTFTATCLMMSSCIDGVDEVQQNSGK